MVEQGTHKPLVGSSTLPPGTVALKGEAPAEARPIGIKARLAGSDSTELAEVLALPFSLSLTCGANLQNRPLELELVLDCHGI